MTISSSTPALCSLDDFLSHDYDYLVVGGGTAGLCIAARLTENPEVKVGVLEAGANRIDDPLNIAVGTILRIPKGLLAT